MAEKRKGQVFMDFNEGKLDFLPTFKFAKGTSTFGHLLNTTERKRDPAWCDRILYRGEVELLSYDICMQVMQSDHKPVYAEFSMKAKNCDRQIMNALLNDIRSKIDKIHNSSLPRLRLSHHAIRFNRVRYKEKLTESVTLHNEGVTLLKFKFRSTFDNCVWLKLSDVRGAIEPGESIEIKLSVIIREADARMAYISPSSLNNILVLHVLGGSDHYIELSIDFIQTAFGAKISDLVKISVPTAELQMPIIQAAKVSETEHAVPKEIWRLLDFIYSFGKYNSTLFVQSGDAAEISLVREALDSGNPFDSDTDVHSVTSVLLELLSSLYEPIVPVKTLDEVCKVYAKNGKDDPTLAQQFLSALPPENFRTFIFICSFLKSLAMQSEDFLYTTSRLASLFLGPLTQTKQDPLNASTEDIQKAHLQQFHRQGFLLVFLLN
mmetsp:Transcript_7089/g.12968  ORF Transcript_7089/g.12968 Transcript_7089/m.12968 type:complete len:435 (-) Transcript_7089:32-1336(-)